MVPNITVMIIDDAGEEQLYQLINIISQQTYPNLSIVVVTTRLTIKSDELTMIKPQ